MSTESILRTEEGKSLKLYQDTRKIWSIGIGYNIQERGLPDDIVEELFRRDMAEIKRLAAQIPEYAKLDPVRAGVIERMVFQLGVQGVMNFVSMRRAIARGDWTNAYVEMLNSEWYMNKHGGGTPARAKREADRMLRGIE